jgi:hypothetical protein
LYGRGELAEGDRQPLAELKVQLDRQRRAFREFGDDPDRVEAPKIVENYEQ